MVNKVILIGNLGRDPETKRFDNGSIVAKFSIATNESYKDKSGEWQNLTEWHNIVTWGASAERVERDYRKGMMVYVEGKLTTRKWQDDSGNDKYITEVKAAVLRKLERKEGGSGYGGNLPGAEDEFPPLAKKEVNEPQANSLESPQTQEAKAPETQTSVEDDLPF